MEMQMNKPLAVMGRVIKTGSGAENQPLQGLDAEPQPPVRAGRAEAVAPC